MAEYVAEIYESSASLIPTDPKDRARMRLFTELCGSTFSYFPLLSAKEDKDFDAALQSFQEGLVNANAFLAQSSEGPFCLGGQFSMAECTMAPFVQRCCAILPAFTGNKEEGRPSVDPLALCDELELTHIKAWMEAVLERPSVVATGVPSDKLIEGTKELIERFAAMAKN